MNSLSSREERICVSVIVPARNEEAALGGCLESLIAQTGVSFEIILVDDHSTDRTREIAESFALFLSSKAWVASDVSSGVARDARNATVSFCKSLSVIEAGPLPRNWTGKNNAVISGARAAHGEWLLFTDADTVHLPGSLARALAEAEEHHVDMLSYSPEQIAVTFWEMAVLPVVFAELAREYPPAKVSDPNSPIAAANGQYILIRRTAYDAIGGHAAVANEILEDVALARAFKASGHKIRFRYAADAVRTRMYRNFAQLREGWTKNLALLFPNPGWLAGKVLALWLSLWVLIVLVKASGWTRWLDGIDIALFVYICTRLRRSNFRSDRLINGALFGMPMFAYLLLRSKRAHGKGSVPWKGRTYLDKHQNNPEPSITIADHSPKAAQRLS